MAVEIVKHHSKQLYRHAAPVLIASLLLVVTSVILVTHAGKNDYVDGRQLGRSLARPVIKIDHTKQGLANITLADKKMPQSESLPDNNTLSIAGKSVNRQFSLQLNLSE